MNYTCHLLAVKFLRSPHSSGAPYRALGLEIAALAQDLDSEKHDKHRILTASDSF